MKRLALIVLCAGSAVALTGCEFLDPKVDSPFSGKPVNEAGLAREIRAEEAKAKAEADAKLAEAADKAQKAKSRLIGTNIALHQKVAMMNAEIEAASATVAFETGEEIQGAKALADAALKALNDRIALINQQADGAYAAIDDKKAAVGGVIGFVANNPFVKSADGVTGGAITGLLGLAGGWLGRSAGSRKRHDQSWEEGYAKAKEEADALMASKDAAWDAAQLALHQLQAPAIPKPA